MAGRGIWGKGRVCSSASYFNSLPAFPPRPSAVVLPRCLPHPPPSPPPCGCLPPLLSPSVPGAPPLLPPPLFPSRIVRLGPSNGGQEAVVLLADCRGANPRPGATARRGARALARRQGAAAEGLAAPGRRFRADRASSQVTLAVPRRGCHHCLCPPHSRLKPRCGGARGGLLVRPYFIGDRRRGCAVRSTPSPPGWAVNLFVCLFIYLFI